MEKMQLLKKLNYEQTFAKLSDLEIDKPYTILQYEFKKTQFNNKTISVTLEGGLKLFLPNRYCNLLTSKDLDDLVKNKIKLVYKGLSKGNGKEMHNIKFIE